MKKILLILTLIFVAFATNAQSIIRVNNNAGIDADYTTLQDAHDGATAGDIIYLEFSPSSYGACTFTKQLTVISTGYFLTENPMTPLQKASATVGNLTLNSGSEGTILTGLSATNYISVSANNITIKRNRMYSISLASDNDISNCIIEQNYILTSIYQSGSVLNDATNSIICNNLVGWNIQMHSSSSATITNNIVCFGNVPSNYENSFNNSTVHNNIFYRENGINTTNTEFRNNLFAASGTNADGNQYSIDMATVFVGTGSTDGQWQISTGSPALGAATDGGECGAFGGTNPYRLSGMPAIPYIYEAIIPTSGSTTNGLPVQIKIRSNN